MLSKRLESYITLQESWVVQEWPGSLRLHWRMILYGLDNNGARPKKNKKTSTDTSFAHRFFCRADCHEFMFW